MWKSKYKKLSKGEKMIIGNRLINTSNYISEATILTAQKSENVINKIAERFNPNKAYSNPFALNRLDKTQRVIEVQNAADSYALSHGNPIVRDSLGNPHIDTYI